MSSNERLKNVVDGIKFRFRIKTQADLAKILGTSPTYLSDLIKGNYPVSEKFSDKLREVFDVNPDYLNGISDTIWQNPSIQQAGSNSIQMHGNGNNFNCSHTLEKAMDEIAAQRKLVAKSQEQIDRLLGIIEKMQTNIL